MHPVLLRFGWFTIYSYGFMLALSFLAGIYVASRRAKRFGMDPPQVLDLSVYIILSAVVGSRLLYVVFHLDEYRNIVDMFAIWEGGATLYGGLILAVLVSYVYAVKQRLVFLRIADVISPSIALGIMLTRIGCFLSGCCYGQATALPWGVNYPAGCAAYHYSERLAQEQSVPVVALHPTQLYASLYGLIIFLVLIFLDRRIGKTGGPFGFFLVLYGISRFALDFFRFYEENMRIFLGLTLNQILSVGLVLIGVFLLARRTKKSSKQLAINKADGTPSSSARQG